MGNLEKAGVGVVVGLLAVILFVAFVNNGESPNPSLNALRKGDSVAHLDAPDDQPQDAGRRSEPTGGSLGGGAPSRIEPGPRPSAGERGADETPPVHPEPRPEPRPHVDPPPVPTPAPTPAPVVSEWPKTVKVQKGDGSLVALLRRAYGVDAKKAYGMVPAVLKANPSLKPTAMRVGDDVTLPAPAADSTVKSEVEKKDVAPSKGEAAKSTARPKEADAKSTRRLPFMPPKKR